MSEDKTKGLLQPAFLILVFAALLPQEAAAVQVHGAPEGLYVHNMAHIFFSAALIFMLYILQKHPIGTGPAWLYLKLSFVFFLLWNIDTLTVHILSTQLPAGAIRPSPDIWHQRLMPPITLKRWIYYIGTFDHVLCVPAIVFMVMSLKQFCHDTEKRRLERSNKVIDR